MTREKLIEKICPSDNISGCCMDDCLYVCDDCKLTLESMLDEYDKQIRAEVIEGIRRAMYHQCFECDNDEDMQKWDSGNWFRYKLFENVIEKLKEQNK